MIHVDEKTGKSALEQLLARITEVVFHGHPPHWFAVAATWVVLLSLLLPGAKYIPRAIKAVRALFPSPDEKARIERHRRFAKAVITDLSLLSEQDAWDDEQYAELEAECELTARPRSRARRLFGGRENGLKRARSLTAALAESDEQIVLLQGEPGSGKSVALRHLALVLAARAARSSLRRRVIPLYVNLRGLSAAPDSVDGAAIREFVLSAINRGHSAAVDKFLQENFDRDLESGRWLFLFDSFDEIPALLSSTDNDEKVRRYRDAIGAFLSPMNQSRGVVASRLFRGPTGRGWPRYRVVPLSERRQRTLVRRALPRFEQQAETIGSLALASEDMKVMASNPLFLRMLCEHVRDGGRFPTSAFEVLGSYLARRLARDEPLVCQRFGFSKEVLERTAEMVAFAMSADSAIGLAPTRLQVREAMGAQGFTADKGFEDMLTALEYIRIARPDVAESGDTRVFSFAHRRIQEFYATRALLREPERVPPARLLTDMRWREPTVTLCQASSLEVLAPLLGEAERLLADGPAPPDAVPAPLAAEATPHVSGRQLHVLRLLQDGLATRRERLPAGLAEVIRRRVLALARGSLDERKLSLDLSGLIPLGDLEVQIRDALVEGSAWLRDAAYWQIARFPALPRDIANEIREDLVSRTVNESLYQEWYATVALLQRVRDNASLLRIAHRLHRVRAIDLCLQCCVIALMLGLRPGLAQPLAASAGCVALAVSYVATRFGLVVAAEYRGFLRVSATVFVAAMVILTSPAESLDYADAIVLTAATAALGWGPSTLYATRVGRFMAPWAWWWIPTATFLMGPVAIIGVTAGIAYVGSLPAWSGSERAISYLAIPAYGLFMAVWVPVWAWVAWKVAMQPRLLRWRDKRQVDREELSPGAAELPATLARLSTHDGRAYLLRRLRERDSLERSVEMGKALRELATAADHDVSERVGRLETARQQALRPPRLRDTLNVREFIRNAEMGFGDVARVGRWALFLIWLWNVIVLPLGMALWPLVEWQRRRAQRGVGALARPRVARDLRMAGGLLRYRDELYRCLEMIRDEAVPELSMGSDRGPRGGGVADAGAEMAPVVLTSGGIAKG